MKDRPVLLTRMYKINWKDNKPLCKWIKSLLYSNLNVYNIANTYIVSFNLCITHGSGEDKEGHGSGLEGKTAPSH